jgi:hypothetical protein
MSRRISFIPLLLICALALAACGSSASSSSGTASQAASASSGTGTAQSSASSTSSAAKSGCASGVSTDAAGQPTVGFEGVPLQIAPPLGSPCTTRPGTPINGVSCLGMEQLAYHIHAHLAVFDDGRLYALPAGVGIVGSTAEQTQYGPIALGGHCYYFLHTHTNDGIIHIESPSKRIYTLGDFFDVWQQPLSANHVASLHGAITAYVNGKLWKKSPVDIPLLPHTDIQLEIGDPAPPIVQVDWAKTQL